MRCDSGSKPGAPQVDGVATSPPFCAGALGNGVCEGCMTTVRWRSGIVCRFCPRLAKLDDGLFMYQIISSAVVNSPPPPGVVSAPTRTKFSKRIDHHTLSKVQKAFGSSSSRKPTKKLLNQRKWCEITATEDAALCFSLRAEDLGEDTRSYDFVAPRFPVRPTPNAWPVCRSRRHWQVGE